MDDLSAALAIRLLLEDSEQLSTTSKGKSREGTFSDAELALACYKSDLEQTSRAIADRRITRSIGIAVQTDGNVLAEFLSQEQEAGNDREVALHLGGQNVPPAIPPWMVSSVEMDEELLSKFSAGYVSSPAENDERSGPAKAENSENEYGGPVSTGFGGPYRHSKKRRCTACQDFVEYLKVARSPCGHEYCEDCLRNLFESSMTDESLFPPRCCTQPISVAAVRIFLTAELVRQFEQKKIEFGTTNRTYCSSSRCSAFLSINNIKGDRGTCPDCGIVTCTMCKAAAHDGDCPADTDLQMVLATAAENGWQRCYSCRRLVELDTGCNHMTCVPNLQRIFLTYLTQLTTTDALAALSSAMSAASNGKAAPALSGMKTVSFLEQLRSSLDSPAPQGHPQSSRLLRRCRTFGPVITATMPAGGTLVVVTNVKSAVTRCRPTSLSVTSAGSGPVTGVGEIVYNQRL
jgi:IBR domain, a half RING-finger domain